MPLRKGHLAMLTASGFLDNRVLADGSARVLVKGRAVKEMVRVDSTDPSTVVEREVVRTEVTSLDLDTGEIADLGTGSGLAEFLTRFRDPIAEEVRDSYPPVYSSDNRSSWGFDLTRLRRTPKCAQGDAVRAAAVALQLCGSVTVSGEMGTGKSLIGAAASYYAGTSRTVIVAPSHLTRKWVRECEAAVPRARAIVVKTITELHRALSLTHRGPLYVVLSKEQAKLSCRWRPAVTRRTVKGEFGERREALRCPGCGREPMDSEGNPLGWEQLTRKRHRCTRVLSRDGEAEAGCGEFLWQAEASPPRTGRGTFAFGSAPPGNTGRGPRRYALAEYISRRCPCAFDTAIIDEVHEMEAKGVAQGIAASQIASCVSKVIGLTGTVFGGRSSSLFYLRYRFSTPEFRREFGYGDISKWVSRYGKVERLTKYDGDVMEEGAMSRRKVVSTTIREKPGVSPAILFHLVGDTIFLRLSDVDADLPPYEERIHLLSLDEESGQAAGYRSLATRLHAAVIEALQRGSKRLLGAYMQALLSWPDASYREETVLDPKTGEVLASAPALPEDVLYPKERELVRLCREQKARDRRVLVYVQHTEKRDITPRLERILTDAGLRVRTLKANTVSSERREEWVAARAREGLDVLICQPRLVKTGLDLLDYPCLVFAEPEYSTYTLRQASRRSWRIGQSQPVEVHYLAYDSTIQQDALSLIAKKLKAALMIEGEIGDEGLSELGQESEDVLASLARRLVEGERSEEGSLEELFAQARELERESGEYIGGFQPERAELRVVDAPDELAEHAVTDDELAKRWAQVFSGEQVEAQPAVRDGELPARTVSWDDLAGLAPKPKSRKRKRPEGQLSLL